MDMSTKHISLEHDFHTSILSKWEQNIFKPFHNEGFSDRSDKCDS
jgi:hypothetical protein